MKLIRMLLGLERLYEVKIGAAFFFDLVLAGTVVYIFLFIAMPYIGMDPVNDNRMLLAATLVLAAYFMRETVQSLYVWHRVRGRNYIAIPQSHIGSRFQQSSIYRINKSEQSETCARLLDETEHWKLYDAWFSFYRRTKHGRYVSKRLYYTVMEVQLARRVPHVIFDSKRAKGRQFRFHYLQAQRISFEGNVDDLFEVYAPETYHIDTLSFISPEVLQAVVAMADCDVEFNGDKLLCYAPLLHGDEMEDFKRRVLALHASVNDNLATYRDDRLAGDDRVTQVTDFGSELLLSPMRYVPLAVLSGLASAAIIVASYKSGHWFVFEELALAVEVTFVVACANIVKTALENRRKKQAYYALRQEMTAPARPA